METICAVPDQHEQVVPGIDAIFETSFDFNQVVSDVGTLKKPPTPQSVGTLLGEWQGFESAFAAQTPPAETIFDAVRNATTDALHRPPEPAASVRPIVPSIPAEEIRVALSPPMEFEEEEQKRSATPSPTQAALARVWGSTAEAAVAAGPPADPGYDSPARSEQPEHKVTTTRSGRRVKVRVKIDASPEPDEAAPARRRPAAASRAAGSGGGGGGPVRNRTVVRARREAVQARSSPLPIPNDGVLPLDHRPARGRGRQQQLKRMTQEQREAEAAARLEKNRVAARECRVRRKEHLSELQDQVSEYEARDAEQRQLIARLNAEVAALRAEVAARR